jgi:hypothetical protein
MCCYCVAIVLLMSENLMNFSEIPVDSSEFQNKIEKNLFF